MRRSGLVVGVTVVALLVAVVTVRDGTAADDADLAVGPQEPSPVPSPEPSEGGAGPGTVVLGANGLPGLRLGTEALDTPDSFDETPSGCRWVWDEDAGTSGSEVRQEQVTWQAAAWAVDDEVVSVYVAGWDGASSPSERLTSWLGPTLGSPIEAAQELPGATTVTERPFGAAGPVIQVVTVPERGVEVVYSDLPSYGGLGTPETGTGRISTMEVRTPGGRACTLADVFGPPPGEQVPPGGLVVDVDGVGPLRLGTSVAALADLEEVIFRGDGDGDGVTADGRDIMSCLSFSLDGGPDARGFASATAHEGVVTEVQVWDPGLATSFGLPAGADADDVRRLFPETAGRSDPEMGTSPVVVDVDGAPVELQMQPDEVWLPDLERPAQGGVPRLTGVVLRTPGTPQYAC